MKNGNAPCKFPGTRGFTLVELAIVMTIIGLIIGGILKGQEFIENAKNLSTIAQVESYRAAVNTFYDIHNQSPGDMGLAQTRLEGCTAAMLCLNGNGDGIIGVNALPINQWYYEDQSAINAENTQFWRHLLANRLISDISFSSATLQWGNSHPFAKTLTGGFHVSRGAGPAAGQQGRYYFRLQTQVSGVQNGGSGVHAISPIDLAKIDRKIDDGSPATGTVIGNNVNDPGICASAAPAYLAAETKDCLAFFEIGNK